MRKKKPKHKKRRRNKQKVKPYTEQEIKEMQEEVNQILRFRV